MFRIATGREHDELGDVGAEDVVGARGHGAPAQLQAHAGLAGPHPTVEHGIADDHGRLEGLGDEKGVALEGLVGEVERLEARLEGIALGGEEGAVLVGPVDVELGGGLQGTDRGGQGTEHGLAGGITGCDHGASLRGTGRRGQRGIAACRASGGRQPARTVNSR